MRTELDFSKVPLDKWVDLYNACYSVPSDRIHKAYSDVNKFAEVQVKEQSDYDAEIAEACAEYFDSLGDINKYSVLSDLLDARKKTTEKVVKEDKEDTEVRSTVDLTNVPF